MKIKKGDKVKVIAGKDNGKIAVVLTVLNKKDKIVVEGVNMAKRHVKPGTISKEGGIISIERPIHVSNVMFVEEKTSKPVRIGYKNIDGKVYRVSKKSGEVLDKKI
jgi:large subunit ribosomal protein L24